MFEGGASTIEALRPAEWSAQRSFLEAAEKAGWRFRFGHTHDVVVAEYRHAHWNGPRDRKGGARLYAPDLKTLVNEVGARTPAVRRAADERTK
jgi:hypothetical protein